MIIRNIWTLRYFCSQLTEGSVNVYLLFTYLFLNNLQGPLRSIVLTIITIIIIRQNVSCRMNVN